MGGKGVIQGVFWRRAHWTCQGLAVGWTMHREAVGCSSIDTHTPKEELPICVSMLGMVWGVQMEGKGDPFLESRL